MSSISIDDIKWTPSGLSVKPKVENFDLQNVKIKYVCGDEQLDAGSGPNAENPISYNYSNCPHILKIKWQETLTCVRATATDNHGNVATCEADIPNTPG